MAVLTQAVILPLALTAAALQAARPWVLVVTRLGVLEGLPGAGLPEVFTAGLGLVKPLQESLVACQACATLLTCSLTLCSHP